MINSAQGSITLSWFENGVMAASTTISTMGRYEVRFGRAPDNDIVVNTPSGTVSWHHGRIMIQDGWCYVCDDGSTNGLYQDGNRIQTTRIAPGDVISIGEPRRGKTRCVMVVSEGGADWEVFSLAGRSSVRIGREDGNDFVVRDPTVSAGHATLMFDGTGWAIADNGSINGTRVNGHYIGGMTPLYSGVTISLGNANVVFLDGCLLVPRVRHGVDVVARDLVRYRKNNGQTIITTDHISLHIKRGEFVAIVGGSGCGKSTLLNELSGGEPADEGSVAVDNTDLYTNYSLLKTGIGFVPQQDIVYDNLTVEDMLLSAAKLRMQPDTTRAEREARVNEIIAMLELGHVRSNPIGRLSGGQKKRASIAVELMADPRLLFLDEPTSGLDPGIERKLMQTLAKMAHDGRTVILVTHTTLNLHLCDQVVFLGTGGKLCYAGRPDLAKSFFGVKDFVDVYGKIADRDEAERWAQQFRRLQMQQGDLFDGLLVGEGPVGGRERPGFFSQLATLSGRYAKLVANDRARALILLAQAPGLAAIISLVAGNDCFTMFEDTKSCLFALSCAAFWVGIFNSIQEICKERQIFVRDYEGGVRLGAYLCSKILVLGVLCLIQTASLTAVFCVLTGLPTNPVFNGPLELFLSLYLTTVSAMTLGLFVSALFKNPDRAMAIAPLLIMPQILFSGLVFELEGLTENISYGVTCRWTMEAMGTTADLNALDLTLYGEKITVPADTMELKDQKITVPSFQTTVDTEMGSMDVDVPEEERTFKKLEVDVPETTKTIDKTMLEHEPEDMFAHSMAHLARSWGVLAASALLFSILCMLLLYRAVGR